MHPVREHDARVDRYADIQDVEGNDEPLHQSE